jgi:hypothetical protein
VSLAHCHSLLCSRYLIILRILNKVQNKTSILYQSANMSSHDEEIAEMKAEIKALEVKLNNATTEPMQIMYGNMIIETRKTLNRLLDAQAAAAGNYTARDLTSFYVTLDYLFLVLNYHHGFYYILILLLWSDDIIH